MGTNHTITYGGQWKASGAWDAIPGLLSQTVTIESADGGSSPLGFAPNVLPRATFATTSASWSSPWRRVPVRLIATVTIDGAAPVAEYTFTGILIGRDRSGDVVSYEAAGWDERIRRARVRTPLRYRRPLATKTTGTSIEDPANPAYAAGLLNEVFFRAGGRPYEQVITYPVADWYYSCDGSSVAPEWGWVDGENAWEEALELAEAAGGQVYQDALGTIRYINPLSYAETAGAVIHFADTGPQATNRVLFHHADMSVRENVEGLFNAAACRFVRRSLRQTQEIYKNRDPFSVDPGATVSRDLAMQWPIWKYGAVTVAAGNYSGAAVSPTVAITEQSAQQLTISITNPSATLPMIVTEIRAEGQPVTVLHEGIARYVGARWDALAAEDVELRLRDSIYTQSEPAARRRSRMSVVFTGQPRPIYQIARAPFIPGLNVGAYALLSWSGGGIASLACRVTRRALLDDPGVMAVDLVPVTGIAKLSDRFVVGRTYADANVRTFGY